MIRLKNNVTRRDFNTAAHQDGAFIITTVDNVLYSFIPETPLSDAGHGDQWCSGTVYPIKEGTFTGEQLNADLFIRQVDTPGAYSEVDIVAV